MARLLAATLLCCLAPVCCTAVAAASESAATLSAALAWRNLGKAKAQLHDYDQAIAAYQQVLKLAPDSPRVFYGLGTAYAAKQDPDHAFEWLARAAATHRYDMTEMADDASLAGLRGDARYAALLPGPADFERPFVEPVQIIHEWRGEAAGDQFGWIARNIGDVDADGVNDLVTSAPTYGEEGSNAGRIYVLLAGT